MKDQNSGIWAKTTFCCLCRTLTSFTLARYWHVVCIFIDKVAPGVKVNQKLADSNGSEGMPLEYRQIF